MCGFAPDSGHIAKGDMSPVRIFKEYASTIRHIHFKDMTSDGRWEQMGKGDIDFKTIVQDLEKNGYEGWIMVEDESARAEDDPDSVTLENGDYVRKNF